MNKQWTDAEIAEMFFDMLKRNGVKITKTDDGGPGWIVHEYIGYAKHGTETLEFCFHEHDGSYWRIMGYVGDFYTDEIHKSGWVDR